MRVIRSLLCGISALALATGVAFAGEEQFSEPMNQPDAIALESYDVYYLYPEYPEQMTDSMATESSDSYDVYYIYPVEVTESYILVPSVDTDMPQG